MTRTSRPGSPSAAEAAPPDAPTASPDGADGPAGQADQMIEQRVADAVVEAQHGRLAGQFAGQLDGRPGGDPTRLPRLLHDAPAVVLLVDVTSGDVAYANAMARDLAGHSGATLPMPVDEWAAAAGLRLPDGGPLSARSSPLRQLVEGQPVVGVPVSAPGIDGSERTMLWATGFPLPSGPSLPDSALLVFFRVQGLGESALDDVRQRAVVAAGLSFAISDPHSEGNPLVWVNPAFERTTGYSQEEAIGRNCRFLQGPDTDPAAVDRLRAALRAGEPVTELLLNYRKDGTAFWNELSISPVVDGAGRISHFVGVQADVTARVLAEVERSSHLAAEQAARSAAEDAQRRLAVLLGASQLLAATLDYAEALDRLLDLSVPVLADWCMVDLVDHAGRRRVAARHRDEGHEEALRTIERLHPHVMLPTAPTEQVMAGGSSLLLDHVDDELYAASSDDSRILEAYRSLGTATALVVPLRARRQTIGVLTLVSATPGRYTDSDLELAAELARRAALALDNARLYQREHAMAESLQRSLLPDLPTVAGLELAARYLPGADGAQVGGDWYDVLPLPDGTVGLVIGDVMGHDLEAAAAMGQLRSVLRSYAWAGQGPARVLDSLDGLVQGLDMAQLATTVYLVLDRADPGAATVRVRWANAGHLPPLVRYPDGSTRFLDGTVSLVIGAPATEPRTESYAEVPVGSLLLLYTDGLVEHRGLPVDEGLDRLARRAEAHRDLTGEPLIQALLDDLWGEDTRDDDIAVLAVVVTGEDAAEPPG